MTAMLTLMFDRMPGEMRNGIALRKSSRKFSRLFAAAALILFGCLSPLCAQSVAVMVNGEPITSFDIEQRTKLAELSTHKTPTRQEVIDELINEKVKIKEAKKYSIDPGVSEIDSAFATMGTRMRLSAEQLTQALAAKGIRPETLKSRLRADMVWNAIVRGRFKESLQVGEKEVQSAVQAEGGDKQQTEAFEYQMRPIILIVPNGAAPAELEARAGAELRGGKSDLQGHAERDHP
jgi:peptidyl-prolyl cis-trans isomerase SurA